MIKFVLKSDGVTSNLNDLILERKLDNDVLVKAVCYQLDLRRWWEYKYNSDQPRQVTSII